MIVLADYSYQEPPLYIVLLGTMGLVTLMVMFGLLRRVFLGLFVGGFVAAVIAWYVLDKGTGNLAVPTQVIGTMICGVFGAIICGAAGFVGKWLPRKSKT